MSLITKIREFIQGNAGDKKALSAQLLAEHTKLFFFLVEATNYFINLTRKYPKGQRTPEQAEIMRKYATQAVAVRDKWIQQQKQFEAAGAKKFTLKFLDLADQKKLNDYAKQLKAGGTLQGLGFAFIPLLWFAGVSLVSWATVKITDMLTTTAEEQEKLINTTKQACIDLKLSPDDCKKMISDSQSGVDNSVLPNLNPAKGGGGLLLLLAAGLAFIYFKNKKQTT